MNKTRTTYFTSVPAKKQTARHRAERPFSPKFDPGFVPESCYNIPATMLFMKIRKLHGEVLDSMMKYHESGKFVPRLDADYTDQVISNSNGGIMMLNAEFDLETSVGNQAFVNMLVYKHAPNISCITEDYINNQQRRHCDIRQGRRVCRVNYGTVVVSQPFYKS